MALITPDTVPIALIFQLFANVPFTWITLACYITASLHMPQRDLGLALGLIRNFRFLGGAVGTTIFAAILGNKATISIPTHFGEGLTPLHYPADKWGTLITAISTGTTATLVNTSANVIAEAGRAIQLGYDYAFKITWLAIIIFGVIACIMAIFVRDLSLYFTKHTSVTLEKERLGEKLSRLLTKMNWRSGAFKVR